MVFCGILYILLNIIKRGLINLNNKIKILIIEDDKKECLNFIDSSKRRTDIEIVGITDSDEEGLSLVKKLEPDGIILDIELNNSKSGNSNSLNFLIELKKLKLKSFPIVIVTTHINSKRTYDIYHKNGADLIIYKGQIKYSANYVFNQFLAFKTSTCENQVELNNEIENNNMNKVSDLINQELDLIGITPNLKGRNYIRDMILYLIEHKDNNSNSSAIQHLVGKYKKSATTITNGIQNAIIHAWRVSSIEDLTKYYTARVNYETGIPTPMEFIYYYVDKINKMI